MPPPAPAGQPPPVSAQTEQSWQHADEIAALALAAGAALAGPVPAVLTALAARALARWNTRRLALAGLPGGPGVRALLEFRDWYADQITAAAGRFPPLERALPLLRDALRTGAAQAADEAGAPELAARELALDPKLADALNTLAVRRRRALDLARALVDTARTDSDLVQVSALSQRAATMTSGTLGDLVHQAALDGIDQLAAADGWQEILHGERNACARCLSFQGAIADGPDFLFRPVLLGAWLRPEDHGGVSFPLHNFCRCRPRLVRARLPQVSSVMDPGSLASVLRREARRSIVLGLALPSESQALRLRAAVDLLHRRGGSGLPKSVDVAARRRIAAGTWHTRVDVRTSP